MDRRPDNFMIAAVIGVVVTLVVLMVINATVRAILTIPLVLVLPGYALSTAIFPRRVFGFTERLLFSIGLSFAVVILGGLMLNWTPWGLQAASWLVFYSVTLGASLVIALTRGWRPRVTTITSIRAEFNLHQGVLLGLAVLLAAGAVVSARFPAPQYGLQGYTQLWMLPVEGNQPNTVRLGISSMEFGATRYKLQVKVDGYIVREWLSIELEPGEKWENMAELPVEPSGTGAVEAVLYRLDTPGSVYRHVTLWADE